MPARGSSGGDAATGNEAMHAITTRGAGKFVELFAATHRADLIEVHALGCFIEVELKTAPPPAASGAYMGHSLLKAGERRQIPVSGAPGRAVIKPPTGS